MPELPEVETVVRTLRPQVLECCIERVDVLRERSLHPLSLPVERLAGTRISAARRRGKLALLDLEPPAVAAALPVPSILAVHLRMTGRFMVHPEGAAPLKHTRIIFHLQRPDGSRAQLFFDDVRSFGLVFAATPELLGRWRELGGRVIIGSDCHDAEKLDWGFDAARALIEGAGYRTVWRLGDADELFVEDEL